jgi:5'-methylthioadenosine phosphorylase
MGRLAVIGGSGLYQLNGVRIREQKEVPTPWGLPSDALTITEIAGEEVVFLPRHGRGHRYLPSEVPSRANIWALKSLGVEQILALSAVGSLSERCAPGEFVLCDNLIDRTTRRPGSYFGDGIVGHIGFAQPFCGGIAAAASSVLAARKHPHHTSGTYVCMEGPAFSTRSESELHRSWKATLIGMTALPEARLAREAEICYATLAMVTDFDCWKESAESVSVEMVVATMKSNIEALGKMLPDMIMAMRGRGDCSCRHAARDAIMTNPALIPYDVRRRLALFYQKYWKKEEAGQGA